MKHRHIQTAANVNGGDTAARVHLAKHLIAKYGAALDDDLQRHLRAIASGAKFTAETVAALEAREIYL